MTQFANTYVQMFFLLAPFFGVSMFLRMSEGMDRKARRWAALRGGTAVVIATLVCFYFGRPLFHVLGITLPAFQIGAGSTLFVSSIMLVLGLGRRGAPMDGPDSDFAVVPLAIPIVVGPGTIGTLMLWSTQITDPTRRLATVAAVFCSSLTVFAALLLAEKIQQWFGTQMLAILTKVTALILVALAAQIIFTGIDGFLFAGR